MMQRIDRTKFRGYTMQFCLAGAPQTKFSLSNKFSWNPGCVLQIFTHVLSTSRKHLTLIIAKSFGECCESTRYWLLSFIGLQGIVFPTKKFASMAGGVESERFTEGVRTERDMQRCLLSLSIWIFWQSQPSRCECNCWKLQDNRWLFAVDLVLLTSVEQGLQNSLDRNSGACDQVGIKFNTKKSLTYYAFPENQASVRGM